MDLHTWRGGLQSRPVARVAAARDRLRDAARR
jgi:hypothetical protein